ncbi:hypothetical protein QP150_11975 [Sphingomonas sp. 22L2VL55-3]
MTSVIASCPSPPTAVALNPRRLIPVTTNPVTTNPVTTNPGHHQPSSPPTLVTQLPSPNFRHPAKAGVSRFGSHPSTTGIPQLSLG